LPYYILWFFMLNQLDGLKINEIYTIACLSFYLSLMFVNPINQAHSNIFGFYGRATSELEKTEQFLQELNHPGQSFLDVFFALKEIVSEKGGLSFKANDIKSFLNQVCERRGYREIDFLYKAFGLFLDGVVHKLMPIEFQTFPFAKHYADISLDLLDKAKDNLFDYIFFPTELAEKTKTPLIPSTFKGQYVNEVTPEKNDWLLFSNILEQFFHKKRIYCSHKILYGTNWHCKNDKECSLTRVDYPYSKCEEPFIGLLNGVLGDVNKLASS